MTALWFAFVQLFGAALCLAGLGVIAGEVYSPVLGLAFVIIGLALGAVATVDRRLTEIRDRLS